ncbi:hypothetical protein MLC35_02815 [Sulfurimonas sp. NW7]|uniref:hypothetical protein n=1 Tax=Sulfurimonas sp. NW7 TaxID=2922727 RepID=UPI003DA8B817
MIALVGVENENTPKNKDDSYKNVFKFFTKDVAVLFGGAVRNRTISKISLFLNWL